MAEFVIYIIQDTYRNRVRFRKIYKWLQEMKIDIIDVIDKVMIIELKLKLKL